MIRNDRTISVLVIFRWYFYSTCWLTPWAVSYLDGVCLTYLSIQSIRSGCLERTAKGLVAKKRCIFSVNELWVDRHIKQSSMSLVFSVYAYTPLYLVHPCDKADKGGCEETCEKKGEEEFICSCPVGYKLNDDGKKCDKSKFSLFFFHFYHIVLFSMFLDYFILISINFYIFLVTSVLHINLISIIFPFSSPMWPKRREGLRPNLQQSGRQTWMCL